MDKSKIKIRLEVWGSDLIFQVLEMDERFRAIDRHKPNNFHTKNGITIYSYVCPSMDLKAIRTLYLPGWHVESDFSVRVENFKSEREAQEMKTDVLLALKDWASNWEGFKELPESEVDSVFSNIYTF